MSIVDTLLETAFNDTQLLKSNDEKGDDFSVIRDIEFVLKATDRDKADIVTKFINDHRYGEAAFVKEDELYRISVVINMPSSQHVVCSVSALMACVAALFDIEYGSWSCVLQNS